MGWLNREKADNSAHHNDAEIAENLKQRQIKELLGQHASKLRQIVDQLWRELSSKYTLPSLSYVETYLAGTKKELILSYCAVAEDPREFNHIISTIEIRSTVFYDEDLEQYLLKYKIIFLDVDGLNSFDSSAVIVDEESQAKFEEKVAEFFDNWIAQSKDRIGDLDIPTELFSEKPKQNSGRWTPRNLWR